MGGRSVVLISTHFLVTLGNDFHPGTSSASPFPLALAVHKSTPHEQASSDSALETSVAILREGIGPTVASAFVIAPLWVPDLGCVGLVTFTNVPYAIAPNLQERGQSRKRSKPKHFVVGAGVVECSRRVGLALGIAVVRIRRCSPISPLRVGGRSSGCPADTSTNYQQPARQTSDTSRQR